MASDSRPGRRKLPLVEVVAVCRYLGVFLTAGVPVLDALDAVQEDAKKRTAAVLADVQVRLRAGEGLADAFAAHAAVLPRAFVSMLRAAEQTGQVAKVLEETAVTLERDLEARRSVRSALAYPLVVLLLALVSSVVLVVFVLPKLTAFFTEYGGGKRLSLSARVLARVASFASHYGVLLVVGVLALVVVLVLAGSAPGGRDLRDRLALRLTAVARYSTVERFSRALASMVAAGVPLPSALELAGDASGNRVFAGRVVDARRRVMDGDGLWEPLAATGLFPRAAVQMLRVGEDTGTLEARLEEVSVFYARELDRRLKRLTALLEPVAVIAVGLVVGFVAYAFITTVYGAYRGGVLT